MNKNSWWVVYLDKNNKFGCGQGINQQCASSMAVELVEQFTIKRSLAGFPFTGNNPYFRDLNEPNKNAMQQAWAIEAPTRYQAIKLARIDWECRQLVK